MKKLCVLLTFVVSFVLFAQEDDMPDHDIALFSLNVEETETGLSFSLTDVTTVADTKGYDNQPIFAAEDILYFTRMEDVNADVWRWKNGKSTRITSTLESEYSPTPIPGMEGTLSTVRVEHDNTQRLWQINPDGSFQLIFNDIKPVGYHAWQKQHVALFILGEPHSLHVVKGGSSQSVKVDEQIGRCLKSVPLSNKISYTKDNGGQHQLRSYDFDSGKINQLLDLPEGVQDYGWFNADIVISSRKGELLWRSLKGGKGWTTIKNSTDLKMKNISRLAISPDTKSIAVVYEK